MTVPDGVTLSVTSRKLICKGPRGTLTRDMRHLPLDMKMSADGKSMRIERWFTSGKASASIRAACSHVENMIIGVTKVRRPDGTCRDEHMRPAASLPLHGGVMWGDTALRVAWWVRLEA